jgi:DNA polymerase delta subunit 1
VATFDFASLYPSIMQAFNICYSTVENLAWARANLNPGDYWIPPHNDGVEPDFCFVKKHIRVGVLPDLLTNLLKQRAYVKTLQKTADKFLYAVLDGRQLALKVVCNSVYGFLKAFILVDPRLMSAVTSWGQEMIMKTADIITDPKLVDHVVTNKAECDRLGLDYEDYLNPNTPKMTFKPVVLYGDTDSVVVDFGDIGVQELAAKSRIVAKTCTNHMVDPNSLSFESVKLCLKLYKKKKYCSLEILAGDIKPEYNTAMAREKAKISFKGIESKRRDNAKIGSETQKEILKMILRNFDVTGAENFVKKVISDILMDRVDMSKFILSRGLSKTEADYAKKKSKQSHVVLADKIGKRSKKTGEIKPETGDRVAFVFIRGHKNDKSCVLAEDPIYVQKHGLPLDKKYYIMKQVLGACIRIFTCIYEPEKLNSIKSGMSNKRMRDYKVYNLLFAEMADHMRQVKHAPIRGDYEMGKFVVAEALCLEPSCRVRLIDPRSVVCEKHNIPALI